MGRRRAAGTSLPPDRTQTTDAPGIVVPATPGDVFSVVSSNPASLGAAIGATAAGTPAVVLTPLVQASPGLTITVSDADGLQQWVQIVDIVQDVAPRNVVLDLADATTVPQAVPTAREAFAGNVNEITVDGIAGGNIELRKRRCYFFEVQVAAFGDIEGTG